jgi:hypothetical protein
MTARVQRTVPPLSPIRPAHWVPEAGGWPSRRVVCAPCAALCLEGNPSTDRGALGLQTPTQLQIGTCTVAVKADGVGKNSRDKGKTSPSSRRVRDALAQAIQARLLAAAGAHGAHAVGRARVHRHRRERVVLDRALACARGGAGWGGRARSRAEGLRRRPLLGGHSPHAPRRHGRLLEHYCRGTNAGT